ncbi:centrosomal protein of 19 kDa-like [Penaeus japonicus]|uniref:centrosomal protein of 19 kDa-like n=1 Tax=Penaeus japonicus TaxID=27405 RepID=UPI001C70E276|nr:centrosomal protein of 19 kDa-like [Penaeus japonicus]XP_042858989.1 centrosomal protein of 19 kDa-like [Penaeus japonicus]
MESGIEPKRLGIRAQPPALILIYRNADGRERQRTMPVRFLNKFGPVEKVLKELKERHKEHLEKVPDLRMEKMLRILQESQKGRSVDEAVSNIGRDYDLDPNQDLNKLNDEQLNRKKKIMDSTFQKNQLKPGDQGYEYDKQVDFDNVEKVEAGWDSSEEDFWS